QALHLNEIAADLARGRNMDLASAAQLLVKVQGGQFGAARRLGIMIDKNATSTQALQQIQQRYAGSAAAYGRSPAGAQERFTVALENMEEGSGQEVVPALTTYLNKASDWLNDTEHQKDVTKTLTTVVDGLAFSFGRLATAIQYAADTYDIFNEAAKKVPGAPGGLPDIFRKGIGTLPGAD